MSTVASTSTSLLATFTDDPSKRITQKAMGQDDFLKLLVTQMSHQDPMNPISDTASIAQLAQFSSLQEMSAMVKEMGYLRADYQLQAAGSLLGREVTVTTKTGDVTGIVDSIEADATSVYVKVNGERYAYSTITQVRPAPAPTPPPATTDTASTS